MISTETPSAMPSTEAIETKEAKRFLRLVRRYRSAMKAVIGRNTGRFKLSVSGRYSAGSSLQGSHITFGWPPVVHCTDHQDSCALRPGSLPRFLSRSRR